MSLSSFRSSLLVVTRGSESPYVAVLASLQNSTYKRQPVYLLRREGTLLYTDRQVLFIRVANVRPYRVPTLRFGGATEGDLTVCPVRARQLDAQLKQHFIRIVCGRVHLWSDTAVPDTPYILVIHHSKYAGVFFCSPHYLHVAASYCAMSTR